MPKPTKLLQARTEDLGLHKNLNKTMLVQTTTTGKGPRGAGFYVSRLQYYGGNPGDASLTPAV